MHYNFIEIGTADFDTLSEKCSDHHFGLCVEPLEVYLNRVPKRPNVKKICCAIIPESQFFHGKTFEIFYIDENDIRKQKLNLDLKGCNSVGYLHDFHLNYKGINLLKLGIVKKKLIKGITLKMLLKENEVTSINLLKTDTEGLDADIISDLIDYYERKEIDFLPKSIVFETYHSKQKDIETLVRKLENLGFTLEKNVGKYKIDTLAQR